MPPSLNAKVYTTFLSIYLGFSSRGFSDENFKIFSLDRSGQPFEVLKGSLVENKIYGLKTADDQLIGYRIALPKEPLAAEKWLYREIGAPFLSDRIVNLVEEGELRISSWNLSSGSVVQASWVHPENLAQDRFRLNSELQGDVVIKDYWVAEPDLDTPIILRTAKFAKQYNKIGGHIAWEFNEEEGHWQILSAKSCEILRCFLPIEDFKPGVYQKFYEGLAGGSWAWAYLFSRSDLTARWGGWPLEYSSTLIPTSFVFLMDEYGQKANAFAPYLKLTLISDGHSYVSDWSSATFATNSQAKIVNAFFDVELVYDQNPQSSGYGKWVAYGSGSYRSSNNPGFRDHIAKLKEEGVTLTLPLHFDLHPHPRVPNNQKQVPQRSHNMSELTGGENPMQLSKPNIPENIPHFPLEPRNPNQKGAPHSHSSIFPYEPQY